MTTTDKPKKPTLPQRFTQESSTKYLAFAKADIARTSVLPTINGDKRVRIRRRADGTFDLVVYKPIPKAAPTKTE